MAMVMEWERSRTLGPLKPRCVKRKAERCALCAFLFCFAAAAEHCRSTPYSESPVVQLPHRYNNPKGGKERIAEQFETASQDVDNLPQADFGPSVRQLPEVEGI